MYRDKLCFIVIAVFYTSICCIVPTLGDHEQCLDGPYHKDKPSKESDAFKFCTPWKNLTCCNVKLDNEISLDNAPKKYNDTWHLCGNLSTNCLMHWKRQVHKFADLSISWAMLSVNLTIPTPPSLNYLICRHVLKSLSQDERLLLISKWSCKIHQKIRRNDWIVMPQH